MLTLSPQEVRERCYTRVGNAGVESWFHPRWSSCFWSSNLHLVLHCFIHRRRASHRLVCRSLSSDAKFKWHIKLLVLPKLTGCVAYLTSCERRTHAALDPMFNVHSLSWNLSWSCKSLLFLNASENKNSFLCSLLEWAITHALVPFASAQLLVTLLF